MNKSIRLLVVIKNIEGGTGTFLFNFLKIKNLFPKNKLIIKTIVLEKPKYPLIWKNVPFLRIKDYSLLRYTLSFHQVFRFIKELIWVYGNVKAYKPDVIISIDVHSNLLSEIVKYISPKKYKTILTTHINLDATLREKSSSFLYLLLKTIIKLLYNRADSLVGNSYGVTKSLANDFKIKKPITTIYYGLPLLRESQRLVTHKKTKIIISIGRLDPQKDFSTLLRAFAIVHKQFQNIQLMLVGDGQMKHELVKLSRKLQIHNSVVFTGWVKNISSHLQKADIFVLATKREGFSYALLEAMSYGIPVISSDAPYGPSELLGKGKYGILVSVGDTSGLAKKILLLLTDKSKYQWYHKRSKVRAHFFSEHKMLSQYKSLIIKLLKESGDGIPTFYGLRERIL